ncbi:kinase-like domain-containing protein [Boletus coccyginus]|nr:kinase-like domain-containing protein [Boletus coccyginus]
MERGKVQGLKTSFKKWAKLFGKNDGWDKVLDNLATAPPGTRAWPNRTKDHNVSFRIDYGPSFTGPDGRPYRNLDLQANKKTKDPRAAAVANTGSHQDSYSEHVEVLWVCTCVRDAAFAHRHANLTMTQVLHRLRELLSSVRTLRICGVKRRDARSSDSARAAQAKDSKGQFFQYTSGRWIYNEREYALERIAATAAGAGCCVQMVKIAEGSFNKLFLLTFDNDVKLIANIPCPVVVPRRLCTASEVATMDYARNVLGLAVPRVLNWSADADASEVGTEYILMEHVQGVELYKRMDKFKREATHFVDQLIDVECKFARYRFSQIGSLYYKEDVPPELQQRPLYAEGVEGGGSDRFRIGPLVDWDIWRGERIAWMLIMAHARPDTLSYIKAIVDIEKQWLSRFAVPRKRCDPFRRPGSENVPDAHIRLLNNFLEVIPNILPPDELCAPVLWHIDLHASNIFVPSEGSPDILGLIDWQGISVRPLFLQASFAACVRYEGDDRIIIPPGMAAPTLPADFESYSEEDKEHSKGQERLAIIHKYYETRVMQRNPLYFASQTYPHIEHVIPPILSASRTWYEVMRRNKDIKRNWNPKKFGGPYPFQDGGRSWFLS